MGELALFVFLRWYFRLLWRGFLWLGFSPGGKALSWLALIAMLDYALTPWLYLLPRLAWPPLHPAWTWQDLVQHMFKVAGTNELGQPQLQWAVSAAWLWSHRPAPGFWLTQAPFGAALLLWARWAVFVAWRGGRGEPRAAREATHGSSRWRRPGEIRRSLASVSCDRPGRAGVVAGANGRRARLTRPDVGNPHVLLIGATRSGKSRRVIMPTIWTLGHAGESMVVTDPKGELHAMTAAWLESRGYEVRQIDLLRPARGNRWNPLDAVVRAWEAGDEEEATRLAWEFGNVMAFSEVGVGTDPIWPQAEESTIAALALGAALEAPQGRRHPATMYRILAELGGDGHGGRALDEWFQSMPADHPARLAYGTAALSESRTRSSIFTGTAAHLRVFADPGIAWLTATSDHDPAQAGTRPMAVFLLLPDEAGARRPIASLYVAQAYSALAGVARAHGGRLPVPVWFLLDEFGNVGRLPAIAEKLTVAAGRGIRFVLAVQSVAQIDHVYGPKVREIVAGNCDAWLFLRANDEETAKAISAKAGTYTVRTTSVSRRPGRLGDVSGSEGATGRPLLTPDEVLRWPAGQSLLLQAGEFPARLALSDLSAWRAASRAFQPRPAREPGKVERVATWVPDDGREEALAWAEALPEPPEEAEGEKDTEGGNSDHDKEE